MLLSDFLGSFCFLAVFPDIKWGSFRFVRHADRGIIHGKSGVGKWRNSAIWEKMKCFMTKTPFFLSAKIKNEGNWFSIVFSLHFG